MKSQSKILLVLLLLTVVTLSTGFDEIIKGRTEIESLYPITLAGIDKNDDPEKAYQVTTVSPTTEEEAQKPINIMTAAGRTLFEANRVIGMYAENDIFWGHTKYVLLGEDTAKDDINKYLDFFMRDNEPRRTILPIIVKGYSSGEVINRLYEQSVDISASLEKLMENAGLTSYYSPINLLEYYDVSIESGDGYLPCIVLEEENKYLIIEHGSEAVEKGQYEELQKSETSIMDVVMHIPGYALIRDGKVVGYMEHEKARGLNWVINKVVSGVIVLEHEGVQYNLEIVEGSSQISPKIEGDTLKADIAIRAETIITEINKQGVRIENELIQELSSKLKKEVEKEVKDAIEIAQEHKIDILGIGNKFHLKYPVKWEKEYKDQWEELFPNLDINILVSPNIERSVMINQSIMKEEK